MFFSVFSVLVFSPNLCNTSVFFLNYLLNCIIVITNVIFIYLVNDRYHLKKLVKSKLELKYNIVVKNFSFLK